MKKTLFIILVFLTTKSFAQFFDGEPFNFCTLSNVVYNPGVHGSNPNIQNMWVVTKSDDDYTKSEKTFLQTRFEDDYSNHTILGESTISYNCHGYSFGIFQGTIPCKITWFEELCNDVFIPITDTNNLQYGDIAVVRDKESQAPNTYLPGSIHSSIVVDKDTFISKWGDGPLTMHHKYDVVNMVGIAMGSSVYTYYRRIANTQINGPDVFNGNATFTFVPDTTLTSCNWSVEPAEMFYQSSGSGNVANLSYKSNLSYLAPKAVITFTFAYSCDNHYTVKKEMDLTIPTSTLSGTITSDGFVIDDGATVTLTGEVRNNDKARTIIKPGGSLVVNGGVMTNFLPDKKWQGIEVWGIDTLHQYMMNGKYHQGYLELKNGATIENAVCAVELWNPGNYSSEGGIIHATDAVFRNNAKAVHAINYTNYVPTTGNETQYNAIFRNCSFVIDSNYIGDEIFHKHVDLDRVYGVRFLGCSFSVDRDVPNVASTATGIAAYSAGFSVDAYCDGIVSPCPTTDLVRSTFTGFHSGINVTNNGSSARTFTVRSSVFSNNDRGIYAENSGYATILKNTFNVGSNANCNFGIYVNGVTNFCIEENSFYGNLQSTNDMYGIAVVNSNNYNEIYLNNFYDLTCGNISVGCNKKSGFVASSMSGLVYSCNNNLGNLNDFCIVKDSNASVNGAARSQGSSSMSSGNTFGASQYHFYNDGDDIISYYYFLAKNQQPNGTKLYRVTTINATNSNSCASHYGNTPVTKTNSELTALENDYQTSLSAYNGLEQLYTSRIDGGNTQAEVADINTATSADAMRLRSQLLGHSPYLSQEVLTTAAQRDDVFSSSVLFEILSANPDELKKDTLINYLENKDNPMPEYMTELLREIANGTTARTALESQMAKTEREYLLAAGDIVRSNLNSEESNNEELRLWLGNMNDMASDRLAVASYIQESDFVNAIALAETLPNVYGLQGGELEEHNDYISLIRLYETLDETGRNTMLLTEEETELVEDIAENGSGASQSMALSILAENNGTVVTRVTCPTLPTISGSSKRGIVNKKQDMATALGMKVSMAPNPATSWTEVEYTLPIDEGKASLVITNALGVNVLTTELNGNQGRATLDLENIPSGVYTYFVRCGEFSQTGKLIIK